MADWTTDPLVAENIEQIMACSDPERVIRLAADGTRRHRERYADVIRVLLTTAPHDETARAELDSATAAYRGARTAVARRLAALDRTPPIDARHADDVLWFYFGYSSYTTLVQENGWSYARAEDWLAEQACRELLTVRG